MKYTKDDIRAIETLKENWHVVERCLERDVMDACFGLGSDANMSDAEIHFRRGAIYATKNFLQLADKMVMAARSQTAMESVIVDDKDKK